MQGSVNKAIALLAINLSTFSAAFMASSIHIIIPSIGREFQTDTMLLGWIITIYLLTITMLLVPMGKAADIYGRKKYFLYGTMLFTLASLLCAFSPSTVLLLCFRAMQGIGGALLLGTGIAILTSVFPPGERGRAMGTNAALACIGLSMAPALGGILTQHLGWRSVFFVNVPIGVLIILLVLWKVKEEWAEAEGEKLDVAGSLIYSFSLIALVYGLTQIPNLRGYLFIVPGVIGLLGFIQWEMKIKNPILNMHLFTQNRVFALSNLAALNNHSAVFALGFLLSLYLQDIRGLNPQNAGFVLISQPAIMAIISPFVGRLSDKIEPRILASCGLGIIAAALILLTLINSQTSMSFIVICLVVHGVGYAVFSIPNTNAIMSSVKKQFYGVASATLATMRLTGQLFSMAIVVVIFSLKMGQTQLTSVEHSLFLSSVQIVFIIFILLCIIGIFASLARGKMSDMDESPNHLPLKGGRK